MISSCKFHLMHMTFIQWHNIYCNMYNGREAIVWNFTRNAKVNEIMFKDHLVIILFKSHKLITHGI